MFTSLKQLCKDWWRWFGRRWLKRYSLYTYFIEWHADKANLSVKNNSAYQEGQEHIEKKAAEKFLRGSIHSRYLELEDAINDAVSLAREKYENRLQKAAHQEKRLQHDLDPAHAQGVVSRYVQEEKESRQNLEQFTTLFYTEKKLQDLLQNDHKQFVTSYEAVAGKPVDDAQLIENALHKKSAHRFIRRESNKLIALLHSFRELVLGRRWPPTKSASRTLFFISCLMVFGEMFISRKVLWANANAWVAVSTSSSVNNMVNEWIILAYSACISVFLACLYAMALELPKVFRLIFVPLLFVSIALFMSYFFSMLHIKAGDTKNFHPKGVMFGVLSAGLALANAWFFRQAGYQKDLFNKVFFRRSLKATIRKKERAIRRLNRRVSRASNKSFTCQSKLRSYESVNPEAVRKAIDAMESHYVATFWHGFNTRLQEMINNNEEIKLAILQKTKELLKYDEETPATDPPHDGFTQPGLSSPS